MGSPVSTAGSSAPIVTSSADLPRIGQLWHRLTGPEQASTPTLASGNARRSFTLAGTALRQPSATRSGTP